MSAARAFNRFISPQITQIDTDYGCTDFQLKQTADTISVLLVANRLAQFEPKSVAQNEPISSFAEYHQTGTV